MAVTRKVLSIEQTTITVPIGETLTINHLPHVLYVNYNVAPYHGYIEFTDSMKENLLVLNPRTGFENLLVKDTPSIIQIDPITKVLLNVPTDIQQEVLLKGGIVNHTETQLGNGETVWTDDPLVFYISILVGGIDYKPASRFPQELDIIDAYWKEPVSSADIPAVDAYQYLISLQSKSIEEDYQLESLKQSLAKKMILARDYNYLGACLLNVERAYFALIDLVQKINARLTFVEESWLPEIEARLFTAELNIEELWKIVGHVGAGLYAARHDAYWRVHAALRHYGSAISKKDDEGNTYDTTAWLTIPIFGTHNDIFTDLEHKEHSGTIAGEFSLVTISTFYPIYKRPAMSQEAEESTRDIKAFDHSDSAVNLLGDDYKKWFNPGGWRRFRENLGTISCVFFCHTWDGTEKNPHTGDAYKGNTKSGNSYIYPEECFHNLIVKAEHTSQGNKGFVINCDHLGYYPSINKTSVGSSKAAIAYLHAPHSNDGCMDLGYDMAQWYSSPDNLFLRFGNYDDAYSLYQYWTRDDKPYVFFGRHNVVNSDDDDENHNYSRSTGFTVQPPKNSPSGPYFHAFVTGRRIFLASDTDGQQYINFANMNGYSIMNFGRAEDKFYMALTDVGLIMEYEHNKKYCGIAFTPTGLKFYGINGDTLDELKSYFSGIAPQSLFSVNNFINDSRMENIKDCNCKDGE